MSSLHESPTVACSFYRNCMAVIVIPKHAHSQHVHKPKLKACCLLSSQDSMSRSLVTTTTRRNNSKYSPTESIELELKPSRNMSQIYNSSRAKHVKQLCLLPLLLFLTFRIFCLEATGIRGSGNDNRQCKEIDTECFRQRIETILLGGVKTIVIDARQQQEILDSKNFYRTPKNTQWINIPCTPGRLVMESCPILNAAWEYMLPDKNIPIIIYCASGKRADILKDFLEQRGYLEVYNAGGIGKPNFLLPPLAAPKIE